MIQIDTKFLTGIGGVKLYQFTAIDVLTKIRTLWVSSSLSSKQGTKFLQLCVQKFPFQIRAVQTDNGHEFLKYFDQMCKKRTCRIITLNRDSQNKTAMWNGRTLLMKMNFTNKATCDHQYQCFCRLSRNGNINTTMSDRINRLII